MITRILPLLNKLIPPGLAMKGLGKIDPRLMNFITGATAAGYSAENAFDFLRDQFEEQPGLEGLRPDEKAAASRVKQSKAIPGAVNQIAKTGLAAAGVAALPQVLGSMFQGQEQQQQQQQPQQEDISNFIAQFSPELDQFIKSQIQSGRSPFEAGALARAQGFEKIIKEMERTTKINFSDILQKVFGGKSQEARMPPSGDIQQQAQRGGNIDGEIIAALQDLLKL